MKKVMVQMNFPGMSSKQYEQAWDEIRKTGNDHPKGLIHHAGAQQGNNLIINDVWESEQAFNEFGKVLKPVFEKIGVPLVQPVISNVLYEQQEQNAGQRDAQGPQGQFGSQGQQPGQQSNQAQQPGQYNNQAQQQPGQSKNMDQQPGQSGNRRNEEEI